MVIQRQKLREELYVFLAQEEHSMAASFENTFWLAKLSYLTAIFERMNQLNLSMQEKGCDIFQASRKVQAFKLKLMLWQSNVSKCNFSDFECLHNFIKTSN